MKQFFEWYAKYIETSDIPRYQPMCEDDFKASKDAFKAGMLAAADIVESIDLSCDNLVTLEMIAEEIRNALGNE